jgi:hypothetical protein
MGKVPKSQSSIPLLGPDWDQGFGFSKLGCPEARCIITSNRSLFTTTAGFSSIVFHQRSFKLKDAPLAISRTSNQLYIHLTLEAPVWAGNDLTGLK